MKKVACMFAGEWILKHRSENPMPVSCVSSYLTNQYGDKLVINKETYSILEFTLNDDTVQTDLHDVVVAFMQRKYEDFAERYCTVEVTEVENTEQTDGDVRTGMDILSELGRILGDDNEESDVEARPEQQIADDGAPETRRKGSPAAAQKVLERIDKLISGAEFKAFAHEVATISDNIINDRMQDVFFKQRLLFSINDGCGLTDYLALYAELLDTLGLRAMSNNIVMEKLPTIKPNQEDPRTAVLDHIQHVPQNCVVCLDISDWMNDVKSLEFHDFLQSLSLIRPDGVLVFRVPFIDKEVLSKVTVSLNDLMFIRELSFPPFSNEEIGRYADVEVGKYGFSMDEKAWDGFFRRIRQESSDGKFYGIDTIRKVVAEMLYRKQLTNAQSGVADRIIREEDSNCLCGRELFDNMSGMEMLDKLVGTEQIKQRVLEIVSQIELARKTPSLGQPALHMRFVGNPGTGKTTIARIIGKILKERGVLRIGEFHEQSGRDFCGRYIGETAPKTLSLCRAAYGSVLFIDEAYSLYRGDDDTKDYGREALDTLIAEMENHRSDFVVIMAGYTDDIERMMKGNSGLESRMPYVIEFPNFSKEQLYQIFASMCEEKLHAEPAMLEDAHKYFLGLDDGYVNSKSFSNARFVRNLYERVCAKAAMRCQLSGTQEVVLTQEDFARSIGDKEFESLNRKKRGIGFGQ